MSEQSLFNVDSLTVDGQALAIVSSSARISGVMGYASQSVPSATGPDFEQHSRVPRSITAQIQFGRSVNPDDLRKIKGARIVLKDTQGPRRCLAPNCSVASLGDVGGGPVDITFNVLEPYQWL